MAHKLLVLATGVQDTEISMERADTVLRSFLDSDFPVDSCKLWDGAEYGDVYRIYREIQEGLSDTDPDIGMHYRRSTIEEKTDVDVDRILRDGTLEHSVTIDPVKRWGIEVPPVVQQNKRSDLCELADIFIDTNSLSKLSEAYVRDCEEYLVPVDAHFQ